MVERRLTVDQAFMEMLGEGPLEKALCSMAIDIKEHPEWPYWVVAGYIKATLLREGFTISWPAPGQPLLATEP